jgi:hypothetical protein
MWSKVRSPLAGASSEEVWSGRPLVATERALLTTSSVGTINLVVLIRLDGPAVDDVLPDALAALRERHPLLRARIVGQPRQPRFDVSAPGTAPAGPGPIPVQILQRQNLRHAYAVAEEEMNTPFDVAEGPLARLTCLSGSGSATDLILTLHHVIADGTSIANLVHELLDLCLAHLTGSAPSSLVPASQPPPLTDLLPASMRGLSGVRKRLALVARESRDEIAYRLGSVGQRRPIPLAGRAVTRPIGLGREQTAALVDRARRQRLTLTSVLAAGLLWQASAVLYRGRPTTMRAVIWADLRPYLDPPVGEETLGCYVSLMRFPIRVDQRRGFATLAEAVQHKIERASRRGDRLPAAQLTPAMTRLAVRWPVGRLGTVALSHAAAPAIRPAYGPIAVREVRAFVANNKIGAELAAASGVDQGELWCDLLYLESDYDEAAAAAIAEGLLSTLRGFADQS